MCFSFVKLLFLISYFAMLINDVNAKNKHELAEMFTEV